MLKVISKENCPRCETIKAYLTSAGISFEVKMAEEQGYDFWRKVIEKNTGKLGFPYLIKEPYTDGRDCVNGSVEEIIAKIDEWYLIKGAICNPDSEDPSNFIECNHPLFSWASCAKCGHVGEGFPQT